MSGSLRITERSDSSPIKPTYSRPPLDFTRWRLITPASYASRSTQSTLAATSAARRSAAQAHGENLGSPLGTGESHWRNHYNLHRHKGRRYRHRYNQGFPKRLFSQLHSLDHSRHRCELSGMGPFATADTCDRYRHSTHSQHASGGLLPFWPQWERKITKDSTSERPPWLSEEPLQLIRGLSSGRSAPQPVFVLVKPLPALYETKRLLDRLRYPDTWCRYN